MSLSQIELVCVGVRVERECFWVNLREDNKVSESKMAVSQSNMAEFKMAAIIKLSQIEWVKFFCGNGGNQSWQVWVNLKGKTKIAESKMAEFKRVEFKMAAIIKLCENEWVWVRLNYFESEWSESVFEWIWEKITRCLNQRWQCLNQTWQNSRWLPSSSWVRMNEWNFFCANGGNQSWQVLVSLKGNTKMAESNIPKFKMAEFKIPAIIMLGENEWVWVRLN